MSVWKQLAGGGRKRCTHKRKAGGRTHKRKAGGAPISARRDAAVVHIWR